MVTWSFFGGYLDTDCGSFYTLDLSLPHFCSSAQSLDEYTYIEGSASIYLCCDMCCDHLSVQNVPSNQVYSPINNMSYERMVQSAAWHTPIEIISLLVVPWLFQLCSSWRTRNVRPLTDSVLTKLGHHKYSFVMSQAKILNLFTTLHPSSDNTYLISYQSMRLHLVWLWCCKCFLFRVF